MVCFVQLLRSAILINICLISSHLSLNHNGCWGTTDDFTTSFLHFSLFFTALLDLVNFRPVHFLLLSSHLFLCLPCLPFSLCLARWFWSDLMNGRRDQTTAVYVSLQWSGGLCVVQLPAGSWHGLPIACWILARTSSLVTWSLFEMYRSIIMKALSALEAEQSPFSALLMTSTA